MGKVFELLTIESVSELLTILYTTKVPDFKNFIIERLPLSVSQTIFTFQRVSWMNQLFQDFTVTINHHTLLYISDGLCNQWILLGDIKYDNIHFLEHTSWILLLDLLDTHSFVYYVFLATIFSWFLHSHNILVLCIRACLITNCIGPQYSAASTLPQKEKHKILD